MWGIDWSNSWVASSNYQDKELSRKEMCFSALCILNVCLWRAHFCSPGILLHTVWDMVFGGLLYIEY